MPEQLTKHPEVTLQVLRSAAGVRCGDDVGAAPAILVQCPAERFCRLPGGELCVYGLGDAPRMTQLGSTEWQTLADGAAPTTRSAAAAWVGGGTLGFVAGLAVAAAHWRWRRSRGPR